MPPSLGTFPIAIEHRQAANQEQGDRSRAVIPAFGHDQPPSCAEFIEATSGIGQLGIRRVGVPTEGDVIAGLSDRQPTLLPCTIVHFMFSPIRNSCGDLEYRFDEPEGACKLPEIKGRG
jgi:hypothetical protein